MLLDKYVHTTDFTEMIGKLVYDDSQVKTEEETYNKLLENLNLDFETLDSILDSINSMMSRTMKVAYKKGFMDNAVVIDSLTAIKMGAA